MKIILYDIDIELCKEWKKQFINNKNIKIENTTFNDLKSDYIIIPGNSFGIMDNGIGYVVRDYYGQNIQDKIQNQIISEYRGFLPVGDNILIETNCNDKSILIYAPLIAITGKPSLSDILYVFLRILEDYGKESENFTLACCGLGTSTGKVSAKDCARMMKRAYDIYRENNKK